MRTSEILLHIVASNSFIISLRPKMLVRFKINLIKEILLINNVLPTIFFNCLPMFLNSLLVKIWWFIFKESRKVDFDSLHINKFFTNKIILKRTKKIKIRRGQESMAGAGKFLILGPLFFQRVLSDMRSSIVVVKDDTFLINHTVN